MRPMRRYAAGTHVRGGLYLDPSTGRIAIVPRRGGRLRGADVSYVRVPLPLPLALLLVPIAGALFVIVFPVVGLALLAGLLCRKVWAATGSGEALTALFAGPHRGPGRAYLLGDRRPKSDGGTGADRLAGAAGAAGKQETAKETK